MESSKESKHQDLRNNLGHPISQSLRRVTKVQICKELRRVMTANLPKIVNIMPVYGQPQTPVASLDDHVSLNNMKKFEVRKGLIYPHMFTSEDVPETLGDI